MTKSDIEKILEKEEGMTVEFKTASSALPKNLFETVCAFLNRNGGTILLGINDDKELIGISSAKAESLRKDFASLSNNSNKIDPVFLLHPTVINFKGKKLIHVFVPVSSQVHKTNGKIFDRSADGDFLLKTDHQISQMYQRKNSFFSESSIYPFFSESDFKKGILDRVRKIIKINKPNHPWNELTNDEFFRTTGLYRRDMKAGTEGFTLAALLLFGKEEAILSAAPHYKIDALVRKFDIDHYDDRITIRCNLIEAYDQLLDFVVKHLPDKFHMIGDQRVSLREKIFREIIANMLIHREYTNAFPSSFIIYNDRVETKNANKPHVFGQLYPDTFQPFPKNPRLAQLFTQMGRSEELGTGLRNVYKFSQAYSGSNDIVFREEDIFHVIIPIFNKTSPKIINRDTDHDTDHDTDRGQKIMDLIKKDAKITVIQMADNLSTSRSTILREIKKLKEKDKLKRIGKEKDGYWEVINLKL